MTFGERCDWLRGAISARAIAAGRALWMTDLLIRLGGGARLAAWKAAGAPVGPFEATFIGDPDAERLVNDVIRRLPPPVTWHVSRGVLVVGQDHGGGFCGRFPKLPPCDEARQIVALNFSDVAEADRASVAAHEFAHAWTFERADPDDVVSSPGRVALQAELRAIFVKYPELIREAAEKDLRMEWVACALAREWGFSGIGTDSSVAYGGVIKAWSRG